MQARSLAQALVLYTLEAVQGLRIRPTAEGFRKGETSVIATNSLGNLAGAVMERHYSPDELGALWNLSGDTVRRLFEREPGVLVIERARPRNARRYRTLRIPESVAHRVHRRLSNPVESRTI